MKMNLEIFWKGKQRRFGTLRRNNEENSGKKIYLEKNCKKYSQLIEETFTINEKPMLCPESLKLMRQFWKSTM
jgi:hypothetical protein